MKETKEFDIVVVGAGPAGLTSALYTGRSGRSCIVLERLTVGGQVTLTDLIENYPGFSKISGEELAQRLIDQVKLYSVPIEVKEVTRLINKGERKLVVTDETDYIAKAVIIATGTKPKMLIVPGEKEFYGKGVSYCALCDGNFFKEKVVAVVGGGDSGVKEAIYLSRIARKVYLIHRRDRLKAEKALQLKAFQINNIEILWSTVISSINGLDKVDSLTLKNLKTNESYKLPVEGVFIYVGLAPNTSVFDVAKDKYDFIRVNDKMMTSIPGVFAAGDCVVQNSAGPWGQISTAVGDGAKAAICADEYISKVLNE
ncbi:MAG: FAD-dependent oxidoreductase [Nitrososphaeria archaeon]